VNVFSPLERLSPAATIAFSAACALSLLTNGLWYRIKFFLRARGYPVSYFRHMQDLAHLNELIATAPPDVGRCRRLRLVFYASFLATLAAFVYFFTFALSHS
jgi:hypothetical protein